MSSPIPPDPYAALGVTKDADISAIRSSHRKLVLKHHPDRIKDPALKERGKNAFQEIQQAYELLSDPVRRTRYDDKIKLAELRKEAMMRDPTPRGPAYPSRHAPSASASREWNSDDQTFYEVRMPKDSSSYFDSKERFEDPQRTTSRKYPEYERSSSSRKPSTETARPEKSKANAKWGAAFAAVNVGIKIQQEAARRKESKSHVKEQELRDREKRRAREEKEQQTRRPYVVSEDSDSDTATRVTSSTIRPSKPTSRHSREPEPRRSSGHNRSRSYTDNDSDDGASTFSSTKWENHHEQTLDYIKKATAGTGKKRPDMLREQSGSFWSGRKSSDSERRPTSSKGRHEYDEAPLRPSMPTQNSAPSNLKSRVDERSTREPTREPRRSATGSYPIREKDRDFDHRKEMGGGPPAFHRSQTMPAPKSSSKKDAAPSKSSNLKHAETHDSGYGSSSSPHTPEMRGESPSSRIKEVKTKYQIVDPDSDDDDRTQVRRVDSDSDHRRRRHHSPETVIREPRREKSDRPERPKLDTSMRSKTTREALSEHPKMRRTESSRYASQSPSATPPLSRHSSARDRLPYELSDSERDRDREPSRYKYPSQEKPNVRPPYQDPRYSNYSQRDSPDRRGYDQSPGSHFQENVRHPTSRRPSVF